jgi:hypothetical protein
VLALSSGGVQVVGQARWTGLGRRWVAEHDLSPSRHDKLVRRDDQEIDDSHEDDEVDDRRDKSADVQVSGITAAIDQLPAQAGSFDIALRCRDEGVDDVIGEGFD